MAKYQKYAEYKDSGVDWLGEIPSHWEMWKLSHAYNEIGSGTTPSTSNEENFEGDIPWVTTGELRENVILDTKKKVSQRTIELFPTLRKYPSGSVAIAMYGATIGRLGIFGVEATTNQACCVMTTSKILNNKYVFYWLQAFKNEIIQLSSGGGQPNINQEKVASLKISAPIIKDQITVVGFLDHETAKIDTLIAKQEKLIELLKEKRQAVISHAVTKGLNPNVQMKDSGVEWLGEVPEHWTVSKLKHFVNVIDCKHITAEFFDEGIPLASIGEVKGWKVNLAKAKLTNETYYQELIDGNRKPQIGDIIYTRNATVGEAAIVHEELPKFALGQDVCLIHIVQKLSPEFLLHFLKSEIIKIQLNSAMVGSTFKRINVDDIRNYVVVIPPIEDQQLILNDLNKKIDKYDSLISLADSQIKFMQERRTALISAAVTGKIDVRNWQHSNKNNNQDNMELSA